jgi:hypothetical protein
VIVYYPGYGGGYFGTMGHCGMPASSSRLDYADHCYYGLGTGRFLTADPFRCPAAPSLRPAASSITAAT